MQRVEGLCRSVKTVVAFIVEIVLVMDMVEHALIVEVTNQSHFE